jgi:hypothetical protein
MRGMLAERAEQAIEAVSDLDGMRVLLSPTLVRLGRRVRRDQLPEGLRAAFGTE